MLITAAAYVFSFLALIVVGFQVALAAGLPWGTLTWGGKYPGRLPPAIRGVAAASAVLMVVFAVVVISRAELAFSGLLSVANVGIWIVVACSAVGAVANAVTKSRCERILWLPVTLLMLASSLIVAIS